MAAAAVDTRKRCATPFLDDVWPPAPRHLPKRGRFSAFPDADATVARESEAAARGVEECAGLLVEKMSAAGDVADATSLASWALQMFADGVAKPLREENAALRAQLIDGAVARRAAELERDNGVLRRGVALQHRQQQQEERTAAALRAENAALKKKVAELEMANYALRLRDPASCSLQALRGPHVS